MRRKRKKYRQPPSNTEALKKQIGDLKQELSATETQRDRFRYIIELTYGGEPLSPSFVEAIVQWVRSGCSSGASEIPVAMAIASHNFLKNAKIYVAP